MEKQFLFWEKKNSSGSEYLELIIDGQTIRAESTVLFIENEVPQKVTYRVMLDSNWFVKEVYIMNHTLGKTLSIFSSKEESWLDDYGDELQDLRGAVDIDISCTPFTNSLPINRLAWNVDEPKRLEMVYISAHDLSIKKVKQIYTLKNDDENKRTFYYRSATFESPIIVDKDGFVEKYPSLFMRKF